MSYVRFALMIATSTLVMFGLMYLNTYALEHVYFSETRVYMALLMGAVMAIIMLAYMMGMYKNRALNMAIFAGSAIVIGLSLWLVRSQATVSGESYMRAMIPHHSIAIMTSERAQIRDPRVRKLADEIIEAQRREIAEMAYLAAHADPERRQPTYREPPAKQGTVGDALANTMLSRLDLAPVPEAESLVTLGGAALCRFERSRESHPVLWASAAGGAVKLNNVLVPLGGSASPSGADFSADGMAVTVRPLGDEADWRADADLVFTLQDGPTIGYRGFWSCEGGAGPQAWIDPG